MGALDVLKKTLNNEHQKIILPSSEGLHIIDLDDIIRCEADDNYTHFILSGGKKMIGNKLRVAIKLSDDPAYRIAHRAGLDPCDRPSRECSGHW